jgi:DNA helicase II / ATP-dependent DNA helicase PcrA
MDSNQLLDGLNAAQRSAVVSEAAPLCILAGAGSGKTRVLTRRIAHRIAIGTADPAHVLAITFTRKAANELTKRLGQLGVRDHLATGTFHAIAYGQLRQYWQETGRRAPSLTESKIRLIAPLLGTNRPGNVAPVDVASEVEWAKARLITPETYVAEVEAAGRRPPLGAEAMAEIYRRYEADKARKGIVDFDDLLVMAVRASEQDRAFAARQQWRFRHLFVDEFQDVNPAQHRLLDAWLGIEPGMSVDRSEPVDLCVVGDPNQAIYAWNGADPRFLTGFSRRFHGAEIVRLEDNYRSTPEILTVADAVLGFGERPVPNSDADQAGNGPGRRVLRPNRSSGPVPTLTAYASDLDEARGIAAKMRELHNGRMPWRQMAVLTRTNAQGLLFEEAFRKAGIPHRVRGNGTFLNQPEVKAAIAMLRTGAPGAHLADRLRDLDELAREIETEGTTGKEGTNDRVDQIDGVIRLGQEFLAASPGGSVDGFVAWLSGTITSRAEEPERGGDVVEISTFHRSKGLEWPVVFLGGLERGYVPIGQADDADGWEEERRLLYVAVTRAERELHCSWAQSRTFGARTTGRAPSPWLSNIEAAQAALTDPGSGDWRTHLQQQRQRVAAARAAGVPGIRGTKTAAIQLGTKADPKLFEELKRWRNNESRRSGVPAYLILHDTTLAAIAEAQPQSMPGLLGLPGMGPVKVGRYGAALLEIVGAKDSAEGGSGLASGGPAMASA